MLLIRYGSVPERREKNYCLGPVGTAWQAWHGSIRGDISYLWDHMAAQAHEGPRQCIFDYQGTEQNSVVHNVNCGPNAGSAN